MTDREIVEWRDRALEAEAQRDEAVELLTGVLDDDEAARFDAVAFLARIGREPGRRRILRGRP